MSEAIEYIESKVDEFNQSIKNDIDRKGMNVSGGTKKSIRRETDEQNQIVYSIGAESLEFLNTGRAPGKFPPVKNMIDWVKVKPISMTDENGKEYSVNQKAYLSGKGIAERGTKIFRDKSKGIQLSLKVTELNEQLINGLPSIAKAEVLQQLNKFNKERLSKL